MFGNGIKKKANADLQKMPTKHLSKAEELYTSNLLIYNYYVCINWSITLCDIINNWYK